MAGSTRQRKAGAKEKSEKTEDSARDQTLVAPPVAAPSFMQRTWKRVVIRVLFVFGTIAVYNWYKSEPMVTFASVTETTPGKFMEVPCSKDYEDELESFAACVPKKCGRAVVDDLFSKGEVQQLLKTAKAGMSQGGSNGGASILDLHSGALSKGDKFIDIYRILEEKELNLFSESDFENYRNMKNKIHAVIAKQFGVPIEKLYLTKPTFFSKMTTKPAKTTHDEYWHVHVDKETYGSFHYTSLLYLSNYTTDFSGGRFVFMDSPKNTTVEPKLGRLSFFTSGSENPHFVERVERGTRYAITVSFTCDPSKAISDPTLNRKTAQST